MPNNDNSLTADIIAGETLMVQESKDKPAATGDTVAPQQNEEIVPTAPEAAPEQNSETYVSGSAKARQLGESRRKLAEGLLKLAKGDEENGVAGRPDEVKKIIGDDPTLDKYFKKAWPKDYDVLFNGTTEQEYDSNLKIIQDQATITARAEILKEQLQEEKREQAYDLALRLKFTQDEANSLSELADKLDGTKIAGKAIDYDQALERAARVIRPDKAKVGIISSGQARAPSVEVVKNEQEDKVLNHYAQRTGRKAEDIKRNLKEFVEPNIKGNVFQIPMT